MVDVLDSLCKFRPMLAESDAHLLDFFGSEVFSHGNTWQACLATASQCSETVASNQVPMISRPVGRSENVSSSTRRKPGFGSFVEELQAGQVFDLFLGFSHGSGKLERCGHLHSCQQDVGISTVGNAATVLLDKSALLAEMGLKCFHPHLCR